MNIAICDDEQLFLDTICHFIEEWSKQHGKKVRLFRFTNGDDLLHTYWNEGIDLIFLDVVMPLLNGIDTAKELRSNNQMVPIVFLTASREFAVDSYEVKALNYLLKPISKEKMFQLLDDFFKTFEKPKVTFAAQTALGFCKIIVDEVEYLEAQNKEVHVHLSNGTTIEIRELFSTCEEFFSIDKGFFKCHRSYLVNLSYVEQFNKNQVTTCNSVLPIARNRYSLFKDAYFNHMFG